MNDYKHNLICLVQKTPLLWDPKNKGYKNKDQRKQVWEKIDEKLQPPEEGVTAKDTWTSLTRCYSNALQRMKSKSGDGAGSSKPRVYMKSMSFLKVLKEKRSTSGNLGSSHDDAEDLYESVCSIDDSTNILEQAMRGSGIIGESSMTSHPDDEDNLTDQPSRASTPSIVRLTSNESGVKQKCSSKRRAEESEIALFQSLKKRLDEKSVAWECPRLGFFKSIMPKIQSLTDDQFIEFQLKVLSDLKEVSQPVFQPICFTQEVMPPNNMNISETSTEISNSTGPVYSPGSFLGLFNNPN